MASRATQTDFVDMVAEEVSSGIDRALGYWLGRIALEVVDRSLTTSQRIDAIENILQEYKARSGRLTPVVLQRRHTALTQECLR